MLKKPFLVAMIAALPFGPALAQYQGPGGDHGSATKGGYTATTVEAIKAAPKDDMKVMLEGRLTSKTGHETYIFTDATGDISVEIDDDDFPREPVNADTIVILEGEVDTHRIKETDIDVDRVTIKK